MSEKYPTCPYCGSTCILITFEANGSRTFLYGSGPGRVIEADDVTDGGEEGADCVACGETIPPEDIAWIEANES